MHGNWPWIVMPSFARHVYQNGSTKPMQGKGGTMNIEQLHKQKKLIDWEIKLREWLPSGDLQPWTMSNICIDPRVWTHHAWLSYRADQNTFKRLEDVGFEPLKLELIRWDNYRPSVCLEGKQYPRYKLTEAWPMCPLYVRRNSFTGHEAIASYLWNGFKLRVSVRFDGGLVEDNVDVSYHPMCYQASAKNAEGDVTSTSGETYWEYISNETMSPAEMFERIIK